MLVKFIEFACFFVPISVILELTQQLRSASYMQWLSASFIITEAGGIIDESRYGNRTYETLQVKCFAVLFCSQTAQHA